MIEPPPFSLESVRRRPGMYIGDTDAGGLHQMVCEVVGNVIDQHLIGAATELEVTLADDGWATVRDDGPGIPIDRITGSAKTVLEHVFTELRSTPSYDGHVPHIHVSDGGRGLGLAVVNALSTEVEIETARDGQRWALRYEHRQSAAGLRSLGPATRDGTAIRFRPDPVMFGDATFDVVKLEHRLRALALLNPMLRLSFQGQRLPGTHGLRGWVREVVGAEAPCFSSRYLVGGIAVDLALGWSAEPTAPRIAAYVNTQPSASGTHVDGMWRGLARALRPYEPRLRTLRDMRPALSPGLVAVLNVGLYHPRFGSPMRDHLTSPIGGVAVGNAIAADLPGALAHDPRLRELLCTRLGIAAETRWQRAEEPA